MRDERTGAALRRRSVLGIGRYAADPRDLASEVDPRNETETCSVTSTLRWQINDTFSLTNITNFRDSFSYIAQGLDVSAVVNRVATNGQSTTVERRDVNRHQASAEFQLSSACDTFRFVGRGTAGQTPVPKRARIKTDLDTDVWAVFGQAVYTFGAQEELSVKAGGCYSHEERSSENPMVLIARGGLRPVVVFTSEPLTPETPNGTTSSTISVTSRLTSDSNGVRAETRRAPADVLHLFGRPQGGAGENAGGSRVIVDPEEIENRETGFKSNWLDNRLAVNFAASYYELTGQQIIKTLPGGPAGWQTVFETAVDTSSASGAEVGFFGSITDRFRMSGSVAYLKSGYDDFVASDPLDPRNMSTPAGDADVRDRSGCGTLRAGDPARRQPDAQRPGLGGEPPSGIRHSRADAARRRAPEVGGGHLLARR